MLARSFLLSAALLAGCKGHGDSVAKLQALAKLMIENTPAPAAFGECSREQLNAPGVTARTLIQIAGNPLEDKPERTDWINPSELDVPAARTVVDPNASASDKDDAAAALLGVKAITVWRPEMVNVPLAIGVKELKRGAVGMRALGYDMHGNCTCITVFNIQNDKAVSEWAMDQTNKALVDPAIAKALQKDLRTQLLMKVADLRDPRP